MLWPLAPSPVRRRLFSTKCGRGVNAELELLDRALPEAWDLLRDGGRFAVISFQPLEDRRAKRFLRDLARGCTCPPQLPECRCGGQPEAELITRRALSATPEEIERNPRSHSARLRAARKMGGMASPAAKLGPPDGGSSCNRRR
jgi:MraW methylase family protein